MLHPSFRPFMALTGTIPSCHLSCQWGSTIPIAIGAGQSSIRASDRKIQAVEIARLRFLPVFCDMEDPIDLGRSVETASFLDGQWESYGVKRLWGGWSARACFMRGQLGRGAWNGR